MMIMTSIAALRSLRLRVISRFLFSAVSAGSSWPPIWTCKACILVFAVLYTAPLKYATEKNNIVSNTVKMIVLSRLEALGANDSCSQ